MFAVKEEEDEEVYEEEGATIDAEVTITIKLNNNTNNTILVKKLEPQQMEEVREFLSKKLQTN